MTWHLAPCLDTLRRQVNEAHPGRDKSSDGTIGNAEHAARKSDHNPDADNVVCAIDLTDDETPPGFEVDTFADEVIAEQIALPSKDRRITYVINDGKIRRTYIRPATASGRPYLRAGQAEPYTGPNPHDKHAHFSCSHEPRLRDDPTRFNVKEDDMSYTDADRKRDNLVAKQSTNQGVALGKILGLVQELAEETGAPGAAASAQAIVDELAGRLND